MAPVRGGLFAGDNVYRLLSLTQIVVDPARQRTEMDPTAIQELATSIRDTCLLHAPVVDSSYNLIAGGRRVEAITWLYEMGESFRYSGKDVPSGMVPVIDVGDLTPVQRYELELEENIRRVDLSWQERAAATARLVDLKKEIAVAEGLPEPTVQSLNREILGTTSDTVMTALTLARNLDNPDVAGAKTQKEALKAIKRAAQQETHAKLAEIAGASFTSSSHLLHHADAIQWMTDAPPEQFDVILTDPPYGMGADTFGDPSGKTGGSHGYSDSPEVVETLIRECPELFYRSLKRDAHLYLFCDLEWFPKWRAALNAVGFRVFRTPLLWVNPTKYRAPWPDYGPQRKWEMILYAIKGDRRVNRLAPDVLTYQTDDNIGHAAQKPVALYTELLGRSALPGDRVFDPFAGSGPIFEAAESLKCTAVGIERDSVHYGVALSRLMALRSRESAQADLLAEDSEGTDAV